MLDAHTWCEILYSLGQSACTLIPVALLPVALLLPFIYKFGIEKGRILYYIVLGGACGILGFFSVEGNNTTFPTFSVLAVMIASLLIYSVSWLLSILFYKKRQL